MDNQNGLNPQNQNNNQDGLPVQAQPVAQQPPEENISGVFGSQTPNAAQPIQPTPAANQFNQPVTASQPNLAEPQPQFQPVQAQPVSVPPSTPSQVNVAPGMSQSAANPAAPSQVGEKSFLGAFLFALFLGFLGVDRYYLGKIGTGVLKMVTIGGFGIWSLIDIVMLLTNNTRDKKGNQLNGYEDNKKIALIIFAAVIILNAISSVMFFSSMNQAVDEVNSGINQGVYYSDGL